MRRLHRPGWSSTALLLALTATLGLAACGDDGPAPASPGTASVTSQGPEAATTAPHPIRFVKGLAAGVAAASGPDALLFVYVARHRPT